MLHGHGNIEMDTTHGDMTNSLKYTPDVRPRFGHDTAP